MIWFDEHRNKEVMRSLYLNEFILKVYESIITHEGEVLEVLDSNKKEVYKEWESSGSQPLVQTSILHIVERVRFSDN